ncbi:alpha/beta hydrolase fold-3 domain-containing protein [Plectosphaerella cucumerina]|uniref:Alpha/beta hydrolase fold-3 domain-containing protein n=1 Tax=Plectosphaerella cucumerina TaxID=40658 RepID=A0A8K0TCK1_9PEZI|nr:alpha/beta hydrolase fold-3 domain-containing protein [Plectosphaerella cucumerina]
MTLYDTKEAVLELGKTHPELTTLLEKGNVPNPPLSAVTAAFKQNPPPAPPSAENEYTKKIPMRDGHLSELRVHLPPQPSPMTRAMFVFIHGGGFCLGNSFFHSYQTRAIASLHNVVVVSLSYRLAPEHKFLAGPNDVWDSMEWLSQEANAKELGCDLFLGFYIGGVSAGGNLSAVTAQRWVSEGRTPKLSGVWACIPYVLEKEIVPPQYKDLYLARVQNADAMVINKEAMDFVLDAYRPDIFSPAFPPFRAENPHTGMPPVYIHVAGQDPLRDDGLIYEKALRAHGVLTRLDVYPGLPHAFDGMFWKFPGRA